MTDTCSLTRISFLHLTFKCTKSVKGYSRVIPWIPFLLVTFLCIPSACLSGDGRELWQHPVPNTVETDQLFLEATFPDSFLWGAGSAALQTEGAWDRDGRGMSIWDNFTHSHQTWNDVVASDSYHHLEEDLSALKLLGVSSYAFSLSWPRLFSNGSTSANPNAAGVAYYSRLIDRLLQEGIEPVVTLYHWDLPAGLQERFGGWNNESLVDIFADYARFCFHAYGERVKYWITIHNPYLVAWHGYRTGYHAPGKAHGPAATFTVGHNLIKAHAKAWHVYDSLFRASQGGRVSIALGTHWMEPQRGHATKENVESCQESLEAILGWFAEPIYGNGDYPPLLKKRNPGLLLNFSEAEKHWVRGTSDFFALSFGPNNLRLGHTLNKFGQQVSPDLRRALSWIKLEYDNPEILIVECGWFSYSIVGVEDTLAIYSMKKFINQVLQAIVHDGVHVLGYTAWSLLDGFEWNYGYSVRRGLFYIDFNDPERTRVPKTSAFFYRKVIVDNGFPPGEDTKRVVGKFPCHFQWGISDSTLQVYFRPFSPQFTDPNLYRWNFTGDGTLQPVVGVHLQTRPAQCTDFLAIQRHVLLLKATGVNHYRFALNWSLILPKGDITAVNSEALRYYRCLLMELHSQKFTAMVTLYYPTHHSLLGLPASLHEGGGWLNRSSVEAFQEYAELCFRELGPWVRLWITINEPNRLSQAYNATNPYLATHHLLLAHTAVWQLYDRDFRHQQEGLVSFSLHADWAQSANPFLESHKVAASRFLDFELAYYLDPFFIGDQQKGGNYPKDVRDYMQEKKALGLSKLMLPDFTKQEAKEVYGAMDFIAVNHFTTRLVSPRRVNGSLYKSMDHDCQLLSDPTWPTSPRGQDVVPSGLHHVLAWLKNRYGDLDVVVTAIGIDDGGYVEDHLRQYYLKSYLQEALRAHQGGVNLKGLYVLRLQDKHGANFGLFTSSHSHPTPKASVTTYRDIITRGGFPGKGRGHVCTEPLPLGACVLCAQLADNKALLFFGSCLFLTLLLLALVLRLSCRRKQPGRHRGRRQGRGTFLARPRL